MHPTTREPHYCIQILCKFYACGKTRVIAYCRLRKISLAEHFWALKKLYKTVFTILFAIKIHQTPFPLTRSQPSTILGGNVLIFAYSFSAINFLVFVLYWPWNRITARSFSYLVSSGKYLIYTSHEIFSNQLVWLPVNRMEDFPIKISNRVCF